MPNYDVTFPEDERQAVILALAKLAAARPGWKDYLTHIANRFGTAGANMFNEFLNFGPDPVQEPQIEDDEHLELDRAFTISRGGGQAVHRVNGEIVSEDRFWVEHAAAIDRALDRREAQRLGQQ